MPVATVLTALPVAAILFVIVAMFLLGVYALLRGANRSAHWAADKTDIHPHLPHPHLHGGQHRRR